MKRIILTKYLLPINNKPIPKGSLVLDDTKVIAMGTFRQIKNEYPLLTVQDYSNSIILPGFVNCHSHLELTSLSEKIKNTSSFTEWILQLGKAKQNLSPEDVIEGIRKGIQLLWDSGVVSIGDISSDYLSYNELVKSSLLGRVYWEYISVSPETLESRFHGLKKSIEAKDKSNSPIEIGISPHSPYTLYPKAYEKILKHIDEKQYPITIHVGESREEKDFFLYRKGGLFDFINNFYPVTESIKNTSPLTYLYKENYLRKKAMLVHLNVLNEAEINILNKMEISVIHCPLSHEYFNHPTFKLKMLLEKEVNVALGTDSLASSPVLNFFEELRTLKRNYSFLSNETIIKMATCNGAKALNLTHKGIGEIAINKPYHLIAFPANNKISDPYGSVMDNSSKVIHIHSKI